MNESPSPGPGGPTAETAKAKGRGLSILLGVRPPISRKDISEIRRRVVNTLSDSFSSVELSYYPRDGSSTSLKILAEQATFRLAPGGVKVWYSQLLERFLRRLYQDLQEMHYSLFDVRVEFHLRSFPREKEGEYIAPLSGEEVAALLPPLSAITGESPPDTSPPVEEKETPPPSSDPQSLPPDKSTGEDPPVSSPPPELVKDPSSSLTEITTLLPDQGAGEGSAPHNTAPEKEKEASPPSPDPSDLPADPGEGKAVESSWLERDLGDAAELPYRESALREYRDGNMEEGITICLDGLEKYPESPYLLYLLGILLSSRGKDSDAQTIFTYLISTYPDCSRAYLARGRARQRLGDETGAEQDFAKARELNPDL